MLSPAAFRVLAESPLIGATEVRAFCQLLADYDLRYYRMFQVYPFILAKLHKAGIMERGPLIKFKYKKRFTYRLHPKFWLTEEAIKQCLLECRAIQEREAQVQELDSEIVPS
jgi:hypothetical protein